GGGGSRRAGRGGAVVLPLRVRVRVRSGRGGAGGDVRDAVRPADAAGGGVGAARLGADVRAGGARRGPCRNAGRVFAESRGARAPRAVPRRGVVRRLPAPAGGGGATGLSGPASLAGGGAGRYNSSFNRADKKTENRGRAMHIRAGDIVMILTGDDRGRRGKVLRVLPKEGKVVVEGMNRVYKHVRPNRRNPQGGRLSKEMPIDVSN